MGSYSALYYTRILWNMKMWNCERYGMRLVKDNENLLHLCLDLVSCRLWECVSRDTHSLNFASSDLREIYILCQCTHEIYFNAYDFTFLHAQQYRGSCEMPWVMLMMQSSRSFMRSISCSTASSVPGRFSAARFVSCKPPEALSQVASRLWGPERRVTPNLLNSFCACEICGGQLEVE